MLVLVESAKKHKEKRTHSTKVVVERKDDVDQREVGVESVVKVTEPANSSSSSSKIADKESSGVEKGIDDDVKNRFLERIRQLEECCKTIKLSRCIILHSALPYVCLVPILWKMKSH